MECNNCGKKIRDNSKFCPFCGMKINDEVPKVPLPKENLDSTDIIADEKIKDLKNVLMILKMRGLTEKTKVIQLMFVKIVKKKYKRI